MVGVVGPKENPLQGYHCNESINSNLVENVTRATLHGYLLRVFIWSCDGRTPVEPGFRREKRETTSTLIVPRVCLDEGRFPIIWNKYICRTEILIKFVAMDDKVVCRISICTARSPGIGGFHEHIKEGLDYIDIPIQHIALWLCVERGDALASCLL